jgi:hypothetical protein
MGYEKMKTKAVIAGLIIIVFLMIFGGHGSCEIHRFDCCYGPYEIWLPKHLDKSDVVEQSGGRIDLGKYGSIQFTDAKIGDLEKYYGGWVDVGDAKKEVTDAGKEMIFLPSTKCNSSTISLETTKCGGIGLIDYAKEKGQIVSLGFDIKGPITDSERLKVAKSFKFITSGAQRVTNTPTFRSGMK